MNTQQINQLAQAWLEAVLEISERREINLEDC